MTQTTRAESVAAERSDDRARTRVANLALIFRRWLANPPRTGFVVPSLPALCDRIARRTHPTADEAAVEPGAGAGVMSRALLMSGLLPGRLIVPNV
jgi:phospholipid N-methyltransferase